MQAHARSCMTSARRQACMKTHTNPSSGLDGTANIHTCARASTRSLTYDGCTKAGMYENTHKSIIRARWNSKHSLHTCARASTRSLTYDECEKAGMYENTHKPIIRARWNSKHTHMRSCKHTLAHV